MLLQKPLLRSSSFVQTKANFFGFQQRFYSEKASAFAQKILNGNTSALSKAITLAESLKREHRQEAEELLQYLLDAEAQIKEKQTDPKATFRIGISGPPGVGKSTFIESFGSYLTTQKQKVAVLAVDPSSVRTGGSVLADKTRMTELSRNPDAFVRPSPSRGTLGGVTRSTGEAISLCEAAGYNIILIETVGVGQSETAVDDLVDLFLMIAPPVGGDEYQVMKKGIMEMADIILVNKADGELFTIAERVKKEMQIALNFVSPKSPNWRPEVVLSSSMDLEKIKNVWEVVNRYKQAMESSGEFESKRSRQYQVHMWKIINEALLDRMKNHAAVKKYLPELEVQVKYRKITPATACDRILSLLEHHS